MNEDKYRTLKREFNIYCSEILGWKLINEQGIEFFTENGKHIHSIYSYDPYENCNQMAIVFDTLPKITHTESFVSMMSNMGIKKTMRNIIMARMIISRGNSSD